MSEPVLIDWPNELANLSAIGLELKKLHFGMADRSGIGLYLVAKI
jgi:hypothetical protein